MKLLIFSYHFDLLSGFVLNRKNVEMIFIKCDVDEWTNTTEVDSK